MKLLNKVRRLYPRVYRVVRQILIAYNNQVEFRELWQAVEADYSKSLL